MKDDKKEARPQAPELQPLKRHYEMVDKLWPDVPAEEREELAVSLMQEETVASRRSGDGWLSIVIVVLVWCFVFLLGGALGIVLLIAILAGETVVFGGAPSVNLPIFLIGAGSIYHALRGKEGSLLRPFLFGMGITVILLKLLDWWIGPIPIYPF